MKSIVRWGEGVNDQSKPPEFTVPLSVEQLAQLGYFNAVWSQIDFIVTVLMARLAKIEIGTVITMTGGATTAPRIAMLKQLADEQKAAPIVAVCKAMGKLIGHRNHLSHGVWGQYWAPDGSVTPGCHYHLVPLKPILASDLPSLIDQVSEASHHLGLAMRALMPDLAQEGPRNFFFGPGDPNSKPAPGAVKVTTEPVVTNPTDKPR